MKVLKNVALINGTMKITDNKSFNNNFVNIMKSNHTFNL